MLSPFYQKLQARWATANSLVCVGLDPDLAKLPEVVRHAPEPLFEFCRAIADATAPYVCAFKPQIAYFAAVGAESQLERLCQHLRTAHPGVLLILDAKRGDIGSTAELYAREAFDRYGADVVTVNPYLGGDTLEPFTRRADKGVFVLCRTSNPGGGELQGLDVVGAAGGGVSAPEPLYLRVAARAATHWNARHNVGLVAGATWPDELAAIRAAVGEAMPLLVPGVGAQGGDARAVVEKGRNRAGAGLVVNSSRAILHASSGPDFAAAAASAALALRDELSRWR